MRKFTTLDLSVYFNADRSNEPVAGRVPWHPELHAFMAQLPGGAQTF